MGSDHDASDSSSEATEEQISISLLPERKRRTKKKFSGTRFSLHIREMCCRKAVMYGGVTTLLLLLVVFLVAITRASSTSDTVNTKDEERYRYDSLSKKNDRHETRDEDSKSLRLPRDLLPIEYLVYLHPNLTTFKFTGRVDILLSCAENTDHIVLHVGNDMKVKNVEVAEVSEGKSVKELSVERITRDSDREMIFIKPSEILQKKKMYFVLIEFESKLSTGLAGFYLSSYTSDSGEKRYLATTHFEPTDARKAFPCFDEPDMKATFTIVIAHEKRHVALANMPKERTDKCGDKDDLCIDHFQKSVKMSTYLVAFVVCDYSNITNTTKRGTQVGVWAPPDQISQGEFALYVAVQVLTYYEELFHVPYPLPKQDLIAIPDFAAGAMENWGLITYRLTSLLYDEKESSDSNKQWVAVVVAHELAHQWFGNLVTMKWWNDLWLNEGFASFMENLGVDKVYPEWKMMEQFLNDKTQLALALDQLSSSHAIKQEVQDPAQINSLFDTISYDKGASIIRMLEEVLGKELFFKGLQVYLQKYKFSNAETDDLWQCLTDVMKGVLKGVDVKEMMDTWTTQMGFPVITVSRRGGLVTAEQERFLIYRNDEAEDEPDDYSWVVPLSYITEQDKDKTVVMMRKNRDPVSFHIPSHTGWIKMNADQTGYYRVNYDRSNWQLLTSQLIENHKKLSAADRAGLLDDAFKLARAGMLDYEIALCLTPYLEKETEYVPWMSGLSNLAYIATQFSTRDSVTGSDDYQIYKSYLLKLLRRIAEELGWNETKGEPHLQKYLRASVLKVVAEYDDDSELVKEGHEMFEEWLAGREVPPNLRNTVYAMGLKHANKSIWNKTFERYLHETVPSEKRKLMYALTNNRNETILKELLSYSLDDSKIRSQDSVAVINSIAQNPSGRIAAWNFTKRNYDTLFKRYGKGSFDFSRLIKATTAHFNTEDKLHEVKTFFSGRNVGSGELAVKQTLESINANIEWINQNREYVVTWLTDFSEEICPFKPSRSNQRYYDMRRRYGRP